MTPAMNRAFNAIVGAISGAVLGMGICFAAAGEVFAQAFAFPGDVVAILAAVFAIAGALWGNDFLQGVVDHLHH
jgi:hypothetical protein